MGVILPSSGFATGGGSTPTYPTFITGSYGLTTAPGVDVAAGNNVKGSYVSLGTLTSDIEELVLYLTPTAAANRPAVLDIQLNGTTVVVTDLYVWCASGLTARVVLPIHIDIATQVGIRIATNAGSITYKVHAVATAANVTNPSETMGSLVAFAANANTMGTSLDLSSTTWIQIGSALAATSTGVMPSHGVNNDTSRTPAGIFHIEIGTGPDAGTVTSLGAVQAYQSTTSIVNGNYPAIRGSFSAGTIFWARAIPLAATATDTVNINLAAIY